jgi:hypothetical protein
MVAGTQRYSGIGKFPFTDWHVRRPSVPRTQYHWRGPAGCQPKPSLRSLAPTDRRRRGAGGAEAADIADLAVSRTGAGHRATPGSSFFRLPPEEVMIRSVCPPLQSERSF